MHAVQADIEAAPDTDDAYPAKQKVHDVDPVEDQVPLLQNKQIEDVLALAMDENVPATQLTQLLDP